MLLIVSILLFFCNFASFHIYNLKYIDEKLTNHEKRNKNKNFFVRLLFLDSFSISNKFLWIFNFVNIIISFLGIVGFFINIALKNTYFENFIGAFLIIALIITALFALISKLSINIKDNKKLLPKLFLLTILILFVIGIYFVIRNGF
ncbi:MAG: hypothetical protein J1E81_05765 [Eubacterium sp.]|nr:hypothetical protein [Eubacterium sp.]